MQVTISRWAYTPMGVFGTLKLYNNEGQERFSCFTLENQWKNNERNVSCIPIGKYTAHRALHHQRYEVFRLDNVSHRSNIDIHIGNTEDDTLGCILLGNELSAVGGKWAVAFSTAAFKAFMDYVEDEEQLFVVIQNAEGIDKFKAWRNF